LDKKFRPALKRTFAQVSSRHWRTTAQKLKKAAVVWKAKAKKYQNVIQKDPFPNLKWQQRQQNHRRKRKETGNNGKKKSLRMYQNLSLQAV